MLPSTYVQSDPADPVSADRERLQRVFDELRCQVCAAPVLDIDDVGWVLHPAANMGGACCTRCMYLAVRSCPRLADAPRDAWEFWAVTDRRGYAWAVTDGRADGHVVVDPRRARRRDWAAFAAHHAAWRRRTAQAGSSGPVSG